MSAAIAVSGHDGHPHVVGGVTIGSSTAPPLTRTEKTNRRVVANAADRDTSPRFPFAGRIGARIATWDIILTSTSCAELGGAERHREE